MAKEYTGSEYIEVVDSTIGIKPEKIIEIEPGPGIGIDYPDGKMKISVNLTDEQRLALKGDKGDTGAPGKDGRDGTNGQDGRDGTNGQDGRNGSDGIQGPPGNNGKDGNNGKSVVLTPIPNGVNIKLEGDTGDGYVITNGTPGTPGEPGAPGQGITNIVQQSVTPTSEGGEEQVFTIYVGDAHYDVKVLNGMKGDTGAPGQGFKITKTYTTVASMKDDAKNIMEGQFVMIASNVEDPDNAQLYVRNSNAFDSSEPFTFIADLSGAQGIKGETGKSVTITTDSSLPKITFTVPAHDNVSVQSTSIQAAAATEEGRGDGVTLTVGDKSATIQGGADIEVVDATDGITIKPTNKTGKDITVSKSDTTHVTTLAVGNKNVTINDGVGVTVEKTLDGIKFTGGTGEASITAAAATTTGRGAGVTLTVGSTKFSIEGGENGEDGNTIIKYSKTVFMYDDSQPVFTGLKTDNSKIRDLVVWSDDDGTYISQIVEYSTYGSGSSQVAYGDAKTLISGKDAKIWSLGSVQYLHGTAGDVSATIIVPNPPSGLTEDDAIAFECQGISMMATVTDIASGNLGDEITYEGGCITNGKVGSIIFYPDDADLEIEPPRMGPPIVHCKSLTEDNSSINDSFIFSYGVMTYITKIQYYDTNGFAASNGANWKSLTGPQGPQGDPGYPSIDDAEHGDVLMVKRSGAYGIKSITWNKVNSLPSESWYVAEMIPITYTVVSPVSGKQYLHTNTISLQPGDRVEYCITVGMKVDGSGTLVIVATDMPDNYPSHGNTTVQYPFEVGWHTANMTQIYQPDFGASPTSNQDYFLEIGCVFGTNVEVDMSQSYVEGYYKVWRQMP